MLLVSTRLAFEFIFFSAFFQQTGEQHTNYFKLNFALAGDEGKQPQVNSETNHNCTSFQPGWEVYPYMSYVFSVVAGMF